MAHLLATIRKDSKTSKFFQPHPNRRKFNSPPVLRLVFNPLTNNMEWVAIYSNGDINVRYLALDFRLENLGGFQII